MLGNFPKDFFPRGNFPRAFSQVATSQLCNFPNDNVSQVSPSRSTHTSLFQPQRSSLQPILGAALGHPPNCSLRCIRGPNLTLGNLPLGKFHIWEVATCEIVTWKVAQGKMTLVKYLTLLKYGIQEPQVFRLMDAIMSCPLISDPLQQEVRININLSQISIYLKYQFISNINLT